MDILLSVNTKRAIPWAWQINEEARHDIKHSLSSFSVLPFLLLFVVTFAEAEDMTHQQHCEIRQLFVDLILITFVFVSLQKKNTGSDDSLDLEVIQVQIFALS